MLEFPIKSISILWNDLSGFELCSEPHWSQDLSYQQYQFQKKQYEVLSASDPAGLFIPTECLVMMAVIATAWNKIVDIYHSVG